MSTPEEEYYLVVTDEVAHRSENRRVVIQEYVEKLPGCPKVEWVKPLTCRIQRLLGWGDVSASGDDVKMANDAKDDDELRLVIPQALRVIDRKEYDVIPALHDALCGGIPALEDCKHEFFT